ncbi:MAG: peptide chain release factor 1 [Planctomycetes bacterium]|nr:peptide chain release factor 1 [Planctomycetota bacterium]
MFDELQKAEARFVELESLLSDPDIIAKDNKYPNYLKEHGSLVKLIETFRHYKKCKQDLEENEELARDKSDAEMAELAQLEIPESKKSYAKSLEDLKNHLLSNEGDGNKNVIMEVRAGTGGDESALFVADMVRMYQYYCEKQGWKMESLNSNPSEKGGLKEISIAISGEEVYAKFKYESGTHRVQRVPETESQGRIHTSAITVAVLPEAEEIDVDIKPDDVRKDLYCASGPGGQCVNTTYSAVRLTHLPTSIVVQCQDEKSQMKNADKAMRVLRSRLYNHYKEIADAERGSERRGLIGSGDRSERIRTYNFPQNRVTDHRINLTLYDLNNIIKGQMEEVIDSLREDEKKKKFGELY